eukprot:3464704-Rhodomonas_salina.1
MEGGGEGDGARGSEDGVLPRHEEMGGGLEGDGALGNVDGVQPCREEMGEGGEGDGARGSEDGALPLREEMGGGLEGDWCFAYHVTDRQYGPNISFLKNVLLLQMLSAVPTGTQYLIAIGLAFHRRGTSAFAWPCASAAAVPRGTFLIAAYPAD